MNVIRLILIFACAGALFASVPKIDEQKDILSQLDIDHSFINTTYYKDIKSDISQGHIRDFDTAIEISKPYMGIIKSSIASSGVPPVLFYLAMVESGLSNHVVSGAKAAGIWQFMTTTAKLYGLRVDKYVDERKDPQRSSLAATRYLRSLKNEFGKWYLAVLAYNCGNTKLRRAIAKAGSDDLAVLLDPEKKYIPQETRRFIAKILRQALIASNLGFSASDRAKHESSSKLVKISVPGGTSLTQVANSIGVGLNKIKENNAHLKFSFTPPNLKYYHVYIPENKMALFTKNFTPSQSKNEFYTYKVKKGDTLLSIAKKTGVNYRAIKEYNELESNKVALNQSIIIPKTLNLSKNNQNQLANLGKKTSINERIDLSDEIASGEHIATP